MPLMSMRQYAIHRGVSAPAVSAAVKRGRIPCKWEGKKAIIDSDLADREWVRNTDPTTIPHRAEIPAPAPPVETSDESPAEPEKKRPGVSDATAVLKGYQARLAKLQFEEKSAKLIFVDKVRAQAFATARSVRDAMMSIPSKVSAELAGETDQFEIHKRLTAEIRQALENLASELTEGEE